MVFANRDYTLNLCFCIWDSYFDISVKQKDKEICIKTSSITNKNIQTYLPAAFIANKLINYLNFRSRIVFCLCQIYFSLRNNNRSCNIE